MATRQPKLSQQLRQGVAEQNRMGDLADKVVHATARLLQRGRYRLHPLNEAAAALALSSETRLPK